MPARAQIMKRNSSVFGNMNVFETGGKKPPSGFLGNSNQKRGAKTRPEPPRRIVPPPQPLINWRLRIRSNEENDALRRLFLQKRKKNSQRLLFFYLLGILFFVLENEAEWNYVSVHDHCGNYNVADQDWKKALIYLPQFFFSLISVILAVLVYIHNTMQFNLLILAREIRKDAQFWNSDCGRKAMLEIFLCLLHVPVGVSGCWETRIEADLTNHVTYTIQVLNIFPTIIRAYLFFRYITNNSRFASTTAEMVLRLYDSNNTSSLAFKDFLSKGHNGIIFFGVAYLVSILSFAYAVLTFERPAVTTSPVRANYPISYSTTVWFMLIVVTTVGFGDWIVVTAVSRAFAAVGMITGLVISACLVSYVFSILSLEGKERKVSVVMDYIQHRQTVPHSAAALIQAWYRLKKASYKKKMSATDVFMKAMSKWMKLKLDFVRLKQSPADAGDLMPKIIGVHQETTSIENMLSEMRVEMAELRTLVLGLYQREEQRNRAAANLPPARNPPKNSTQLNVREPLKPESVLPKRNLFPFRHEYSEQALFTPRQDSEDPPGYVPSPATIINPPYQRSPHPTEHIVASIGIMSASESGELAAWSPSSELPEIGHDKIGWSHALV